MPALTGPSYPQLTEPSATRRLQVHSRRTRSYENHHRKEIADTPLGLTRILGRQIPRQPAVNGLNVTGLLEYLAWNFPLFRQND